MSPKPVAPIAAHVKLVLNAGKEVDYFRMSGGDLKADAEAGDTLAAAEIARRKTNRASKTAAKREAAQAAA